MLGAERTVPAARLPWEFYDSLSGIAKGVRDVPVEIRSTERALSKAQVKGSGAPASEIGIYEARLRALGVTP